MKTLVLVYVILFCSCNTSNNKQDYNGLFVTVVIDSCEYIDDTRVFRLIHKENCRYCEQRRIDFIPKSMPVYERYFMFSYEVTSINGITKDVGSMYQISDHFPSNKEVSNFVYSCMPNKRSCYQNLIIRNIFEFKDKHDFDSYMVGYEGNLKVNKHKKHCISNTPIFKAIKCLTIDSSFITPTHLTN